MEILIQTIKSINFISNCIGGILLAPIAILPGWLSITIISVIMGIILLFIFKHTSNQEAIGQIRNSIQASLLSIRLFKDCSPIPLKAQSRLFVDSFRLLFHSIIPMLVMIIPVLLILVQLGLWYQYRPLVKGENVIVKLETNEALHPMPSTKLAASSEIEIVTGPVTVLSRKEVYWKIKTLKNGYYDLIFTIGDQTHNKSIAVGSGLMRLSPKRPGRKFSDILFFPLEDPFDKDSLVTSISIEYHEHKSGFYGTDYWILYFFIISMIAACISKPVLKVRL